MRTQQLLLALLLLTPVNLATAATITTCPNQCGGYSDVQAAVNEASPGDTVELQPGVYRESIVLNKSITLVGSGEDTILLGNGPNPVLTVTADDVEIRSLKVGYCLFGVQAEGVSRLTVRDCSFVNCSVGVLVEQCAEVEVGTCVVEDSMFAGVKVVESANVSVAGCAFRGGVEGVNMLRSGSNTVLDSSFEDYDQGIILDNSNQNHLKGNAFHGCVDAVVISTSGGNTVEESEAVYVERFISSYLSSRNLAADNLAHECVYAYDSLSTGNVYNLGAVNVSGEDYILSLTEAATHPGYEPVADTLNISLIPGTLEGGYAEVSVKIDEHTYLGRTPRDLGLYRVADGRLDSVAQGYIVNATVRLNATIRGPGLYSVLLWRDTNPPNAIIEANITAAIGENVVFYASDSTDDVGIERYSWRFGDGEEGEGEVVEHVYSEPGVYNVTLTVADPYGNIGVKSTSVIVEEPGGETPGNLLPYVIGGVALLFVVIGLYVREKRFMEKDSSQTQGM